RHKFLDKTSSTELLDQLSAGEAFGRAAEPWEVAATIAFLASEYSSYLTGEVISVSSQHPRLSSARRTAVARSYWNSPRGCSPNAGYAQPPCVISPTAPASSPAACTTISLPRKRWSTKCCGTSWTGCSLATRKSLTRTRIHWSDSRGCSWSPSTPSS